jgi:uncharacterized protein (DUF1684 family)
MNLKITNLLFFCFLIFFSCNNQKIKNTYETDFQRNLNVFFKDATTSPLKENDLKNFNFLPFFSYDSTFVAYAKFELTPESTFFDMKTSTSRISKERIYGILKFEMNGNKFQLKVYQSKDSASDNKEDLLLPFLDETNGISTYGGGRYINLKTPLSDEVIIDFNKAYNPYCAYNELFSCPIVPEDNYLPFDVKAGVMYKTEY